MPDLSRWLLSLAAIMVLYTAAVTQPEKNGIYMDQMTFLLQAASFAEDFDFVYDSGDRERFLALGWGNEPRGLFLRKSGSTFYYAKPFVYALLSVPFSRFAPNRGPLILNALIWIALVEITYRTFRRNGMSPNLATLIALSCWGLSAAIFHVYVIHPDLLIMLLVALMLYLIILAVGVSEARRRQWLLIAAGVVTAAAIYEKLPVVFLTMGVAWHIWRKLGKKATSLFLTAIILPYVAMALVHVAEDGSWNAYQGNRVIVTEADPYSPRAQSSAGYGDIGTAKFFKPDQLVKRFAPERILPIVGHLPEFILHLLAGRKIGLFPYHTPLLLVIVSAFMLCLARKSHCQASWILLPCAAYILFYWFVSPGNYQGGPTTLGNRYLMQISPALVIAAAQVSFPSMLAVGVGLASLLAAVYFPGRLLLTPSTAVRDNWLVFQWNRFKPLPVEAELLPVACDRYDSKSEIGSGTLLFRMSEPGSGDAGQRFWLGVGAKVRLGILRNTPDDTINLRLSSTSFDIEGTISSGSISVPFRLTPDSSVSTTVTLTKTRNTGFSGRPAYFSPLEIQVTSGTEVRPELSVNGGALHVNAAQPLTNKILLNHYDGTLTFDPGSRFTSSRMLWGWWDIPEVDHADRFAGGSYESAIAIPPTQESLLLAQISGASFLTSQTITACIDGYSSATFALHAQPTTATLQLPMPANRANDIVLRLRHESMISPYEVTQQTSLDTRELTALYSTLRFTRETTSSLPLDPKP